MLAPITVLAIFIVVGALAFGLWNLKNNHRAQNARSNKRRKSDRIKLNSHQRKLYKEAKRHFQKGNIKASAKILESLGMIRESVDLFEKGRFIHEAAGILLRINRPNRAGKLYQRNRHYKEATECYKKANMSFEVGYCAQKSGDNATAAVFFLDCGDKARAASCFEELGKCQEAARLYIEINKPKYAIRQLSHLLDKSSSINDLRFSEAELDLIANHLQGPGPDLRFVDIRSIQPKLHQVLAQTVKAAQTEKAAKLLARCPSSTHLELLQRNDFSPRELKTLAQVFEANHQFDFSGMIYERQEDFANAGHAFKKHEDYERAAYCYERINLKEEALEMKIEAARTGTPKKTQQAGQHNLVYTSADSSRAVENPFKIELTENSVPAGKEQAPVAPAQKSKFPKVTDTALQRIQGGSDKDWRNFEKAPILASLSEAEKESLKSKSEVLNFKKGDLIFEDNTADAAGLFFVLQGSCVSAVDAATPVSWPSSIVPDSLFSEKVSRRRFIAAEDCVVMAVQYQRINEFLDENGTCAQKIFRSYLQLKKTESATAGKQKHNLAAS